MASRIRMGHHLSPHRGTLDKEAVSKAWNSIHAFVFEIDRGHDSLLWSTAHKSS